MHAMALLQGQLLAAAGGLFSGTARGVGCWLTWGGDSCIIVACCMLHLLQTALPALVLCWGLC